MAVGERNGRERRPVEREAANKFRGDVLRVRGATAIPKQKDFVALAECLDHDCATREIVASSDASARSNSIVAIADSTELRTRGSI